MIRMLSAFLAATMLVSVAQAQDGLADGVRACADIEKTRQRLACFDALAASLKTAPAPPSTPAAAAPAVVAPAPAGSQAAVAETFGAADIAKRQQEKAVDNGPKSLDVEIVRILYTESGKGVFELSNGQIWIQTEAETRRQLEIENGAPIEARLQRRMFGGYWLKTKNPGRSLKVERRK